MRVKSFAWIADQCSRVTKGRAGTASASQGSSDGYKNRDAQDVPADGFDHPPAYDASLQQSFPFKNRHFLSLKSTFVFITYLL